MVNRPEVKISAEEADDLAVLSALLKSAGLPATADVAERVWPFWIAARRRARHVEANVASRIVPAHASWPSS